MSVRRSLARHRQLVGRDRELTRVTPILEGLRAGAGGVVEIVGEPRSGKTRFLHEVEQTRRSRSRFAAPTAGCTRPQRRTSPIRQLLESVVGLDESAHDTPHAQLEVVVRECRPQLQQWTSLLGVPLGLEIADSEAAAQLDESFRKQRLEEATVDLLAALVDEPTILCFEARATGWTTLPATSCAP